MSERNVVVSVIQTRDLEKQNKIAKPSPWRSGKSLGDTVTPYSDSSSLVASILARLDGFLALATFSSSPKSPASRPSTSWPSFRSSALIPGMALRKALYWSTDSDMPCDCQRSDYYRHRRFCGDLLHTFLPGFSSPSAS